MTLTRRTLLPLLAVGSLPGAKKATAFGLIGDRYHNSDYIRTGLNRTIAQALSLPSTLPMKPAR